MSTGIPPSPYFDNINFNPNFFKVVQTYLTEAIANLKYLKLIGGTLTGFLGIGRAPRVGLDVYGKAIIDTGANIAPANGQFGSNGTRIILYDGSSTEPPYALGINTNTLWYGTSSTGSHKFYTGTNERLVINSSGLVGIGTTDPKSKITINATPIQTGSTFDYSISPITITNPTPTSTTVLNDPVPVLYLCRDGTASQSYASKATFNLCRYENNGTNSRTRLDLALTNNAFNDVNIMSIRSDGRVGIGITNPISRFTIKSLYGDDTSGLCIDANDPNTYNLKIYPIVGGEGKINWNFQVNNLASSTNALIIKDNGYIGVANTNPANIFQVGSGERLRISNSNNDYSIIGTSDTSGINNTRIVLNGSTRSVDSGDIHYRAVTATGSHTFFTNETVNLVKIIPDDFQISTSCSTYGANYFTEGEFLNIQTKTNTAGTSKTGYFYTTEFFFNSLVNFACSHTTPNYGYWHGHIGTNNSTEILYFSSTSTTNMTIESFKEQITNKTYIYMVPNYGGYNSGIQMRVKFYG